MKTSILTTIALSITLICNAQWWGNKKVKGNGDVTTITRTSRDYDGIKCAGSLDYVLVKGDEGNITIKGESNLLEYIITEVKGNNLVIKTENNVYLKPSNNKPIIITIPFDDIDTVSLSGSGDLYNKDIIKEDELTVSLSGSGDIVLDVEADYLKGKVTGSGDVTLNGNTDSLDAKVTGSGDFHGKNLKANIVDASVTGSGDVEVYCSEKLKARVTGSGDIEFHGNPKYEDTKVTGSGDIDAH